MALPEQTQGDKCELFLFYTLIEVGKHNGIEPN